MWGHCNCQLKSYSFYSEKPFKWSIRNQLKEWSSLKTNRVINYLGDQKNSPCIGDHFLDKWRTLIKLSIVSSIISYNNFLMNVLIPICLKILRFRARTMPQRKRKQQGVEFATFGSDPPYGKNEVIFLWNYTIILTLFDKKCIFPYICLLRCQL